MAPRRELYEAEEKTLRVMLAEEEEEKEKERRENERKNQGTDPCSFSIGVCILMLFTYTGLSLRAGGRGFSPATKRVAPGYFYWKIEEK